jgi:hypothetical protein
MPDAAGNFKGIRVPKLPASMEKESKELQGLRNIAEITHQGVQDHLEWLNSEEHAALLRRTDGPGWPE